MGVMVDSSDSMVSWDVFVQLNCFLKHNSCSKAEEIRFFVKLFDPEKKKIVPRMDFNKILNMLFGGGIKYKQDEVTEMADKIQEKMKKGFMKKNLLQKFI